MERTIINSAHRSFIFRNDWKPVRVDGIIQYKDRDNSIVHGTGLVGDVEFYQEIRGGRYLKVSLSADEIKLLHNEVLRIEAITGTYQEDF